MGGGGSSSSSSSTSSKTDNIDKRLVVDGGSLGISSDSSTVSVVQTDAGAQKAANDLATNSLVLASMLDATAGQNLNSTLGVVGKAIDSANNSAGISADQFNSLLTSANDNLTSVLSLEKSNSATVGGAFDSLLTLAGDLFAGNFTALKTSQQQVNDAYQTATETKQAAGTIDNRTMIVLGIAAAGALVMIKGKH